MARALDLAAVLCGLAVLSSLVYWWWRPEELFLVLLGVVALRLLVAPMSVPSLDPRRVVIIATALYAVVFSFITVRRHMTLQTHALDLGYYVQLTWNLARGAGPRVSLPEMHAWGDHFSPIMYLFVPAFWLAPGAPVLLVAQSVALALGALAVFGIAARRLADERPAALFATARGWSIRSSGTGTPCWSRSLGLAIQTTWDSKVTRSAFGDCGGMQRAFDIWTFKGVSRAPMRARLSPIVLALVLVALTLTLTPLAYADPPDPTWIAGLWDDDDFDDVVVYITSAAGLVYTPVVCERGPVVLPGVLKPSAFQAAVVSAPRSASSPRAPPIF